MAEIPVQTLQEGSGDAVGQVTRSKDPVMDVSKLLQQTAATAESSPGTDVQADPPGGTWDIQSLAEKLGTDTTALYDGLKVKFEDGTELSLTELKDSHRPLAELEKARGQLVEEMTSSKEEVMRTRQEFGALLGLMPREAVTPELVREAERIAEQERVRNSEQTLKLFPEWKDPIRKAADFADIRQVAREAGYTDAEVKAAELGYADPRMLKMAMRAVRGNVEAKPKPATKVGVKPIGAGRTPAQQFGQLKAAVTSGRTSPFTAVEQLLKGK